MQGKWTKEDFVVWRRRCGLSLSDAAAVLHASRSSIASWQNGARSITARTQALAERSEEHTSELQSLMRISYAVFCLKKKTNNTETRSIKNESVTTIRRT